MHDEGQYNKQDPLTEGFINERERSIVFQSPVKWCSRILNSKIVQAPTSGEDEVTYQGAFVVGILVRT